MPGQAKTKKEFFVCLFVFWGVGYVSTEWGSGLPVGDGNGLGGGKGRVGGGNGRVAYR